jgi:hypothetical protein
MPLGIPIEEYQSRRASGLKHCTSCRTSPAVVTQSALAFDMEEIV